MKKILLAALLLLTFVTFAQDKTAPINYLWKEYASDTTRTYTQITHLCDSLFTQAGYGVHTDSTSDSTWHEGSKYWKYNLWKYFWSSRFDVATGKLHDFVADAHSQLTQQNRTTSSSAICSGTSDLQYSLTGTPKGWRFIGPRNITMASGHGQGNSLEQWLGQIHSIAVNPANRNEIYIADPWGGLWKTINANLAPYNTWTSLSDNLPQISGIGVQQLHVDFSTSPHSIFCLLGYPDQPFMPENNNSTFRAVGMYFSANDGATFSPINLTSSIPDIGTNPVLCMKYWPGNSTSSSKYLFIGTKYNIFRVNVTVPTTPTLSVITAVSSVTSLVSAESPETRFRGFTDISFNPNDNNIMYVCNKSNYGQYAQPNTAALYRITDASFCTTCPLSYIPVSSGEVMSSSGNVLDNDKGTFNNALPLENYSGWYNTLGWTKYSSAPNYYGQCIPHPTNVESIEMDVHGSYLHPITYKIAFKLTLPPFSVVKVVLKDVKTANVGSPDWGTDTIPTPGPFGNTYYVGSGYVPGGSAYSLRSGYYVNDSYFPHTETITTASPISITPSGFVNRLEFAVYPTQPGFTAGDKIQLDDVSVVQEYEHRIENLATNRVSGTNYLYAVMSKYDKFKLFKIEDNGSSYPRSMYDNPGAEIVPDRFVLSPTNGNIIYQFRTQTDADKARVSKLDVSGSTPVYTDDVTSISNLHPDTRSLTAMPNADNTDDTLYIGTDGGIAKGKYGGPWYNLNGTNLNNSWLFDIGTSLYTGMVGTGNPDNGTMWSQAPNYTTWNGMIWGDGAQMKYGKREYTRNTNFFGWSGSGKFENISSRNVGGEPVASYTGTSYINIPALGKFVTTTKNEYMGSGTAGNYIYSLDIVSGHGTTASPFNLDRRNLSLDPSFSIVPVTHPDYPVRHPVQAIGPDMYDATYMAAYMKKESYEQGYFAYSTNLTASTPTWTIVNNAASLPNGTSWQTLLCMTVDPRSPRTNKRIWVGAAGYVTTPDSNRVFENTCGGGACWTDMSYGLPKGPVTALAYDDQSHYLFAGTDQGVYAFNVDNGPNSATNQWECYSLYLPNSFITGLDINRCTGKIYAATLGRGAYAADLPPVANNIGSDTVGVTDVLNVRYIGSNTTISGEIWENRDVYVKSGATLTISNATMYMGKDKRIMVEQGAKLIVESSRLTTSCGCHWDGIQAWGQHGFAQLPAYQAVVQINNSSIENAVVGVRNYNPHPDALNSEGGIIKTRNSKFLNNVTSVLMRPFLNYTATGSHSDLPDLSNFVNTEFSINNDYKLNSTPITQLRHVQLDGVRGVQFMGCDFTNYHSSLRGQYTGIYAFNAGCKVIPHCAVIDPYGTGCASGYNPSSFRGLARGIHVVGTELSSPHHDVSIDNTIFDTVGISVHIHTHRAVSVTRSTFHVGNSSSNPFVEGVGSLGVPSSCGRNVGILAQNARLFKIEGNTFTGHSNSFGISPWHNIGVLAANAGNATNRIYRNAFTSLTYGVLGVGTMANNYPSLPGTGLQVSCNTFSNNTNDIYSGGSLTHQGIGINQVGPSGSGAGNTFSGSTRNIVNPNLTRPLYYYNDFGSSVTTTGNVTLINAGTATCSSTLPSTASGGIGDLIRSPLTALGNVSLFTKKATYFTSRARRDSISLDLTSAIDLGNTNALRYFIDTCANADTLFGKLTDVSPFLSRSVMDHIITKTIQVGSAYYQPLIDVMALNPEVISDYTYLKKAEQDLSMSSNDFDMLWDIASTTVSARGEVELAKGTEQATMDAAISDVILALKSPIDTNISQSDTTFEGICLDTASIYYLSDTNSRYIHLDSLDTWLALVGSNAATHERIGLRLAAGSYQQAAGMFNSLGYAAYNGDTTPTEQQEYSMLWDVLLDAAIDGRSVFYLSDSDRARLVAPQAIDIAANAARASAAYIVHVSPYVVFPCASAPASGKNGNNDYIKYPGINNTTTNKKDKLKAYPNPSDGIVTFQYQPSGMGTDDITVTVLNVLGEKVWQQNIESTTARLQWNAAQLPSGIYLYTGTNSKGTIIGKGKIVLNR